MTLAEAAIQLAQNPSLVALCPPQRMLIFSPTGWLMMLGGRRPEYARLRLQDFLNTTWECVTPDQLQMLATQSAPGES